MKHKIGDKIGRLTILDFDTRNINGKNRIFCFCQCECGNRLWIRNDSIGLEHRKTRSCGCYGRENSSIVNATHNQTKTITYKSWFSMKQRCYNSNNKSYKNYGARGIVVCDRWLHSFENFLKDMGERPSLKFSLDRVDSNGIYEPSNCKWSTMEEQQNNKRNSVKIKINDKEFSIKEIASMYNIGESRIRGWRRRGMSIEDKLKTLKV